MLSFKGIGYEMSDDQFCWPTNTDIPLPVVDNYPIIFSYPRYTVAMQKHIKALIQLNSATAAASATSATTTAQAAAAAAENDQKVKYSFEPVSALHNIYI